MKPLLLIALFSLPLAAEPIFSLFDCKGRERVCQALFPGQRARFDGGDDWRTFYVVGDRIIVNGLDLGPVWAVGSLPHHETTYLALYYRDHFVVGWRLGPGDVDEDGRLFFWNISGGIVETIETEIGGGGPGIVTDANSNSHVIGNAQGLVHEAFYDSQFLSTQMLTNMEQWDEKIVAFGEYATHLMRINDAGQILGTAMFRAGNEFEERLFVLSPVGVPVSFAVPEPGTWLLVGSVVGVLLWRRVSITLRSPILIKATLPSSPSAPACANGSSFLYKQAFMAITRTSTALLRIPEVRSRSLGA